MAIPRDYDLPVTESEYAALVARDTVTRHITQTAMYQITPQDDALRKRGDDAFRIARERMDAWHRLWEQATTPEAKAAVEAQAAKEEARMRKYRVSVAKIRKANHSRTRFAVADLDLTPTDAMARNAARGLELREKHGRGGTAVGVARARDIKNKANLSPETVKRMHSFFSRHEGNQAGGEDDAGYIAWLLWGGDSGKSWAARKVEQIDKAKNARFASIDRAQAVKDAKAAINRADRELKRLRNLLQRARKSELEGDPSSSTQAVESRIEKLEEQFLAIQRLVAQGTASRTDWWEALQDATKHLASELKMRFSHNIALPKGKRRLNIDEASAALAQMGYRLGNVRYDPAAGGSVYKVTQPNGSVVDMPAAKLTDFIYQKAQHMKTGTKSTHAATLVGAAYYTERILKSLGFYPETTKFDQARGLLILVFPEPLVAANAASKLSQEFAKRGSGINRVSIDSGSEQRGNAVVGVVTIHLNDVAARGLNSRTGAKAAFTYDHDPNRVADNMTPEQRALAGKYQRAMYKLAAAASSLASDLRGISDLAERHAVQITRDGVLRESKQNMDELLRSAESASKLLKIKLSRNGAKAAFGLERSINIMLSDAKIPDSAFDWKNGFLIVDPEYHDRIVEVLKGYIPWELKSLPRIRKEQMSRTGAKAAFSVDSRIEVLRQKVQTYIAKGGSWQGLDKPEGLAKLVGDIINGSFRPTDTGMDNVESRLRKYHGMNFSRKGTKASFALTSWAKKLYEILNAALIDLEAENIRQARQKIAMVKGWLIDYSESVSSGGRFSRTGAKAAFGVSVSQLADELRKVTREATPTMWHTYANTWLSSKKLVDAETAKSASRAYDIVENEMMGRMKSRNGAKSTHAAEVIQKLSGGWVIERDGGVLYLAKGAEAIPVPSVEKAIELHKASSEGRLARRTGGFMSRTGAKSTHAADSLRDLAVKMGYAPESVTVEGGRGTVKFAKQDGSAGRLAVSLRKPLVGIVPSDRITVADNAVVIEFGEPHA